MDGSGGVVANLILFAVVCLAPTVLFWCALRVPKLLEWVREKRASPQPDGPPIERVAADLRRVHRLLAGYPSGTPAARRIGTRQAYDELLTQACRQVGVPHRLGELPEGMDREIERLRVEQSLRERGLAVP
ncbi:hypothetical protein [Amycolatopsis tolypomycina]|uniref:DUF4129 domain-containing protein n=1 Tax=Amycolatopsis tolypomycina TaxID=208445 RepID=A0A1H4RKK3_9PSEU|nr:hypothetical protein [Amycolatopsis tolypomycina]SEC32348.1 hypothetical protein SAMN04489727_3348 [Amycolatopsis tolypomycina]